MPYWGINEGTLYLSDTETTYANESFDWPSGSISASTWPWHSERSNILNVAAATLDVSNVTSMSYMFSGCSSLTTIDSISDWNVGNVINMSYMFNNCDAMLSITVENWDVSKVNDMSYMFNSCNQLASIGISNWDTSNVTNMSFMFNKCAISSINLNKWDVGNVINMSYMFNNCTSLKTIDITHWDVSNVTDMRYMFYNCAALTSIDMSGWDTSNVTNMSYMFEYCGALTSLNLRNWTVDKVTDFSVIFAYCLNLTTIYCNNDWSTNTSATGTGEVFYGCSSLTGAISYDATKKSLTYANPTTGYFTTKEVSGSGVNLYVGIDNLSRLSTSIYVGINGVARKVIAGYVGVDNKARRIYSTNVNKWPTIGTPLSNWTWSEIIALANSGEDVTQYFAVGDEKEIVLTTGEVVTAVIGDFYHNTITETNKKAAFAFTFKNCLSQTGEHCVDSGTNAAGWSGSVIRTDVIPEILAAFPSALTENTGIKSVDVLASKGGKSTTIIVLSEKLRLHSATELGVYEMYDQVEGEGTEYPYYATAENRIKYITDTAVKYWTRSVNLREQSWWLAIDESGNVTNKNQFTMLGIAPCFDI